MRTIAQGNDKHHNNDQNVKVPHNAEDKVAHSIKWIFVGIVISILSGRVSHRQKVKSQVKIGQRKPTKEHLDCVVNELNDQ